MNENTKQTPTLLDAANAMIKAVDLGDDLEDVTATLETACAAEEAGSPCGVIPREVAEASDRDRLNADAARMISRLAELEAENAELRAGLKSIAALTASPNRYIDDYGEIARAILAKAKGE